MRPLKHAFARLLFATGDVTPATLLSELGARGEEGEVSLDSSLVSCHTASCVRDEKKATGLQVGKQEAAAEKRHSACVCVCVYV